MGARRFFCALCAAASLVALEAPKEAHVLVSGRQVAYLHAEPNPPEPRPLLVFLPAGPGDAAALWAELQPLAASRNWALLIPLASGATDDTAGALAAIARDYGGRSRLDPARMYLAGRGEGASAVFYAAARLPGLWAAALAIGGSPAPAMDTNRLFAGNTRLSPVLWVSGPGQDALRKRLLAAGYNLDRSGPPQGTAAQALDWLAARRLDPFPSAIDCESGNADFGRCYWAEMTRLDPSRRNDVLASTRIPPLTGAALALGGFGYEPSVPGPGVEVRWLPENYKGPLKLQDRIVSVGGKPLADAREYIQMMSREQEDRRAAVLVQRGKERLRIETHIVVPKREEAQTARLQAEFLSDSRELQIISRGLAEVKLTLPAYWAPCPVNWNGQDAGRIDAPGCWAISEGGKARRCGE
jgi:hypothetical protein